MNILEQLDHPGFKPSKSDRTLMEYIRLHGDQFCTTPIASLARKSGISESTITRFVRKMGFCSLQHFKLSLAEELSRRSQQKTIISHNITADESIMTTAKKLMSIGIDTLRQTVENLDEEVIAQTVRLLTGGHRVYFIGLGNSGFVADDSAYKFQRIGIDALGLDNSHLIMLHMALIHPGDVVIAISHSGASKETVQAARLARQNGARLIAITASTGSELRDCADLCISYKTRETMLETGSIVTKLTQVFIIDLIYTQVVKERPEPSVKNKQRTADAVNLLRLGH